MIVTHETASVVLEKSLLKTHGRWIVTDSAHEREKKEDSYTMQPGKED